MQQRSAPQQLRAKRTRRDLLAAARRAFAELGYGGATIDDIARAAGCSKGAYYFHFATKEEALLALVDEWVESRTRRLQKAAGAASVVALVSDLLSSSTNGRSEPRLLLEFWAQGERSANVARRLAAAHVTWRNLVARAVGGAQEAGDLPADVMPEALAGMLLAVHDGLVVRRCLGARAREEASAVLALLGRQGRLRATG